MWRATARQLPIDSIAPNLYELGDSIQEWAQRSLELAGGHDLIVVGNSVGGMCALEVAAASPAQVKAVVLIGSKADVNPDPSARDAAVQLLEAEGVGAAFDHLWAPLFGPSTPSTVIAEARALAISQGVAAIVTGVRAFHDRRDLTDVAKKWNGPLVGISGALDTTPLPAKLEQIASGEKRTFHLVPDCGHYASLERPSQVDQILHDLIEELA